MIIVGVDEVGRGCLVGDVVASAVVLPNNFYIKGLTDSKKISAKKREELYQIITKKCLWATGKVNAQEIDKINILQATMKAMRLAVNSLNIKYDKVLVDGNKCPNVKNCEAVIKGDLTHSVISAASIVAKVIRDRQMVELDKLYPQYGFAQHKGYGTKQHLVALKQYGAIKHQHRYSFAPIKRLNSN